MQHFSNRNFINQNFWFFWIVTHASACHYTVSYNILLSFLKPNVIRIVRMSVMMSNIWSQRECIESIKTILFCSFLNIINDTNFIDHYMNAAGLRGVFFLIFTSFYHWRVVQEVNSDQSRIYSYLGKQDWKDAMEFHN